MAQNKSTYYRLQRELIQIQQQFQSTPSSYNHPDSVKLSYISRPLDLLRPQVDASSSTVPDSTPQLSISYDYSYRVMVLIAVWNQCEILLKHAEGTSFSTEETAEIYANFNAFKAHPHTPNYLGIFRITDDEMYWVAVCWHRLLTSLPQDILQKLNLISFYNSLHHQITQYTKPKQSAHAFLSNEAVEQNDVVNYLENQFKEIYNMPKRNRDALTDVQLKMLIGLRVVGSLTVLGLTAGFSIFILSYPLFPLLTALALLALALFSLMIIGLIFQNTRVNLTIASHAIQENNRKYNELKEAIVKEFPNYKPQTSEALIEACDKLDDDSLTCAAKYLLF